MDFIALNLSSQGIDYCPNIASTLTPPMHVELKPTADQSKNNERIIPLKTSSIASFEELSGKFDDKNLPWLDRGILFRRLDALSAFWRENGYLIAENLIEHQLIDNYCNDWIQHNQTNHKRRGGATQARAHTWWSSP